VHPRPQRFSNHPIPPIAGPRRRPRARNHQPVRANQRRQLSPAATDCRTGIKV
ncbi:MAG: hypothetical protein, partial [Olavius algarvensis Gamma 3 endosymbiont]